MRFLKRINTPPYPWCSTGRFRSSVVVVLAVAVAIAVVPTLPRAFLPPFNEGTLVITMTLNPASRSTN